MRTRLAIPSGLFGFFPKTKGTYAMKKTIRTVMTFILFALMSSAAMVGAVVAAGSGEIDIKVDGTLTLFKKM